MSTQINIVADIDIGIRYGLDVYRDIDIVHTNVDRYTYVNIDMDIGIEEHRLNQTHTVKRKRTSMHAV